MFAVPSPWGRWETAHQPPELLLEASVILRRRILLAKKVLLRFVFELFPQFSPRVKKSVIEMNLLFFGQSKKPQNLRPAFTLCAKRFVKDEFSSQTAAERSYGGFWTKLSFLFFLSRDKIDSRKNQNLEIIFEKTV